MSLPQIPPAMTSISTQVGPGSSRSGRSRILSPLRAPKKAESVTLPAVFARMKRGTDTSKVTPFITSSQSRWSVAHGTDTPGSVGLRSQPSAGLDASTPRLRASGRAKAGIQWQPV